MADTNEPDEHLPGTTQDEQLLESPGPMSLPTPTPGVCFASWVSLSKASMNSPR